MLAFKGWELWYRDSKLMENKSYPIAYASRALSIGEGNCEITELETLAVVWAISHFRGYLCSSRVIVCTDHSTAHSGLLDPHVARKHARWKSEVYSSHALKEVNIIATLARRTPVPMSFLLTPVSSTSERDRGSWNSKTTLWNAWGGEHPMTPRMNEVESI